MASANKERENILLFGHFILIAVERIARGILWVARFGSFVCSIDDYSKLKTSRPDTLFLCHTAQTFERFRRTKSRSVKQIKAKTTFV